MSKFTFKFEDGDTCIEHTNNVIGYLRWDELVDKFDLFVRANGYVIDECAKLTYVDDNETDLNRYKKNKGE